MVFADENLLMEKSNEKFNKQIYKLVVWRSIAQTVILVMVVLEFTISLIGLIYYLIVNKFI